MYFLWKRPENVPFPSIWHTFMTKENNNFVKYIVQDLPENRFNDAVKFMTKYFLPDAVLCKPYGNFFKG